MVKGLSSIRSVIIQAQVINKIGQPDDRVARIWVVWSQEWLQTELDNAKFCYQSIMTIAKICNILGFFKSKHVKFRVFFAAVKKKGFYGRGWWRVRTVQLLGYDVYCPITLSQPIRFENFVIVMMIIITITKLSNLIGYSTALISALIGQFNRTVCAMPK